MEAIGISRESNYSKLVGVVSEGTGFSRGVVEEVYSSIFLEVRNGIIRDSSEINLFGYFRIRNRNIHLAYGRIRKMRDKKEWFRRKFGIEKLYWGDLNVRKYLLEYMGYKKSVLVDFNSVDIKKFLEWYSKRYGDVGELLGELRYGGYVRDEIDSMFRGVKVVRQEIVTDKLKGSKINSI